MRAIHTAALLAVIACLTAGPSAQGLADAARRASAAPKQPATKKYTNDDVEMAKPAESAPGTEVAAQGGATDASKGEAGDASASAPTSAEEAKDSDAQPKKTPEYVLARIPLLKAQLANKEKQLRELQARGDSTGAAKVKDQMATVERELAMHEARVKRRD